VARIVVLCPDHDAPSGGVRRLYRHVDVLARAGFDAVLLHQKPGFRCTWFENATRVAYAADTPFRPGDWVVVPEVFGPDLAKIAPGLPKVVFNQNAYLTFTGYSVDPADRRTPYTHPEVRAALVVSDDNRDYLAYPFPRLALHRVHYGIDPLFRPAPAKRPLVAYMPRKNAADVVQVVNLLKHRGALDGFRLVPVDGQPEAAVAALLAEAAVFLSFGHPEGCPLPPLEAMASGCVVVGYHGRGGREYLLPEHAFPVEAGDVVGFARAAERVLALARTDPSQLLELGGRARAFVAENYSPRREERGIVSIWQALLSGR